MGTPGKKLEGGVVGSFALKGIKFAIGERGRKGKKRGVPWRGGQYRGFYENIEPQLSKLGTSGKNFSHRQKEDAKMKPRRCFL